MTNFDRALADMTPEQRANCIGMWCEYPDTYDRLGIIYALDDENDPWILRFDAHPEHDTHLCLRKKGHKGYHQDKNTGLSWKWEEA